MNILRLADRLHKTPEEIREGFTLGDYRDFLAYDRILKQEQASQVP